MTINKETIIDQITVVEGNVILVRKVISILEDGVEISKSYHRTSFDPGSDVSSQPQAVQDICAITWTKEVVDAYKDSLAK